MLTISRKIRSVDGSYYDFSTTVVRCQAKDVCCAHLPIPAFSSTYGWMADIVGILEASKTAALVVSWSVTVG